jgi:purine-binding chemotaxis protein CheW
MQSNAATLNRESPAASKSERAGKYLIFQLGKEEFGAPVLTVREIMGVQDITAVPHTPAYIKGVINLRGKVIPVIDLRLKFGMPELAYTRQTCIIVVQVQVPGALVPMGLVVDGVAEVLTVAEADIEDTPNFGHGVVTDYLLGLAKIQDKVKILLNIDLMLNTHELQGLDALLQS